VLQILSWWRGLLGAEGIEDWNSALEDVAWVLGEVLRSLTDSDSERVGKRVRDIHTVDETGQETGVGDDNSQYASTPRRPKR
jgi:hypothetical protein